MPASPTRLRLLLLVLAALAVVFFVRNLADPKRPPAPDLGMEALRRAVPEIFEPLDRVQSEDVQQALAEDPVAFVAQQLQKRDTVEVVLGLFAIQEVVRQQGHTDIFRGLVPRVLELTEHDSVLVRSFVPCTLANVLSSDAEVFRHTALELMHDPDSTVLMAAAGCLAIEGNQDRDLENALLEAAASEPRPPVRAVMLETAGRVGGERAAAALLDAIPDERDDYPRGQMLEALGRCGRGMAQARQLLLDEAFSLDARGHTLAGARTGLVHLLPEEVLADLDPERIEALQAVPEGYSPANVPTAILLARVARAKQDAQLAKLAADRLTAELWMSDVRIARELLALENLTKLRRRTILDAITRLLKDPIQSLPFEDRRELREIRDALR